jgi:hypothetical protein
MERVLLFIDFEIESCENRIDEEKNEITRLGLKERMKAFKQVKHRLESELDHDNGMPQLRAFGSIPLNGIAR